MSTVPPCGCARPGAADPETCYCSVDDLLQIIRKRYSLAVMRAVHARPRARYRQIADAVTEAFEPQIADAVANMSDFKSELQERLAQRGEFVTYRVVSEEGPPHERMFETVAEVDGRPVGSGTGRSKKESEQRAAHNAVCEGS